jgi:predicted RNA binding protein YcfA (HicA-like mRNA interferase family)
LTPIVKVRDLIQLLESNGWRLKTTKGSDRRFKHSEKRMVVTVPGQLGKDLPVGTLRPILPSAGVDKETQEESNR